MNIIYIILIKILITVYDDGKDKAIATITGQQEVAQMMRSLESAAPIAVFKKMPDLFCEILFRR